MMSRGFTLIECMIVLACMSVLSVYAFAPVHDWRAKWQARFVSQQIIAHVQFARAFAWITGEIVRVCPWLNSPEIRCGLDWSQGIQVFVGADQKFMRRLRVLALDPARGSLSWHGFHTHQEWFYRPEVLGFASNNGHFTYCPARAVKWSQTVEINKLGRARVVPGVILDCLARAQS